MLETPIQTRKLGELLEKTGLEELIITAPDNIEYFLGIRTIADSALLLHYTKRGEPEVYVPLLEYYRFADQLGKHGINVYAVSKTLKPADAKIYVGDWKSLISRIGTKEKIGVDKSHLSPLNHLVLKTYSDKLVDISPHINKYRMVKEEWEIRSIRRAVEITGKGIYAIVNNLNNNSTETELAGYFEHRVRREGVDEYAFSPLILFKPGNSYPHNLPSNKRLRRNNLVLADVGVKYNGRCSDITRMIIWGRPSLEEKKAIEVLIEAIDNVVDHIQPGVTTGDLATIATNTLDKYGLRDRFIHGLGHGFGILVHEPPYLREGDNTPIEPGMVFTVEPGIYFPGIFGVRIEEDVLVTKKAARVLSGKIEKVLLP